MYPVRLCHDAVYELTVADKVCSLVGRTLVVIMVGDQATYDRKVNNDSGDSSRSPFAAQYCLTFSNSSSSSIVTPVASLYVSNTISSAE